MPEHSNDDKGNADRAAIDLLHCPSCKVTFPVPKQLDKFKGRRSKCTACGIPFRFSVDGLSLTVDDSAPSSKPAKDPASASGRPSAPAPVKPAEPLGDAFPDIDLGAERPRQAEPAPKRSMVPLAIAAAALLALMPTLWLVLGSSKKEGTIQVELQSPAPEVTVIIDGKPVGLEQLKAPLTLAVGSHRLEASGKGLVAFQGTLPVFEGTNPPFPVKLTAVPRKLEAPKSEAAEEVATAKSEPQPEATADAKPVEGAAEVAAEVPAEKVEADPAVVGEMPAAEVKADPRILGDMPAEEVKADPRILGDVPDGEVKADPRLLGPEPKAGPKSNASLKQIASDPESYLDSSVIPSDLVLIDTGVVGGPAGKRPGPIDLHLVVKSGEGAFRNFVKPGTSFEILLTDEAAASIRDQVRAGKLVGGEYPAIVKFKMTKDPKNPKGFVGLVEWIELLVYVDPRPIHNGKTLYNKVFTIMRVTDSGAEAGLSRSYAEWRKRLTPTPVLNKLKVAYNQAFTLNRGLEYDRLAELARAMLPANSKMLHDYLMNQLRGR